jgi:hypothetical protein
MKKLNLCISVIGALIGIGGAYASTAPKAPSIVHDWVDITTNATVLWNLTTAQAQTKCTGNFGICLKAKDNFNVITRGSFTFGR